MKNSRGQALTEFIIVVPILIFIIMAIIDFGNITIKKMRLENSLDTIVSLYQNQDFKTIHDLTISDDFSFSYTKNQNISTIVLTKNVKIFTPFLNLIFGENYLLETSRTVYEK